MSKKASNSCFRHLNPKHKLRRRIRPQTTDELVRKHIAPATESRLPARTVFFRTRNQKFSAIRKFAA
jgi:hypothetical protein